MWQQAQKDGARTELGAKLGPDLEKVMRANALLGVGVQGIKKFGYGWVTRHAWSRTLTVTPRGERTLVAFCADRRARALA